MSVGEDKGIGRTRPKAIGDPAGPIEGLAGALPSGGTIGKEVPSRTALSDLRRGEPFVVPIVPLQEVGVESDPVSASGQLGRCPGPKKGARQDNPGREPRQKRSESPCLFDPAFGQGEVGAAGVAAGLGPEGRSVANKNNGHGRLSPCLFERVSLSFFNRFSLSDFGKNIERRFNDLLRVLDGIERKKRGGIALNHYVVAEKEPLAGSVLGESAGLRLNLAGILRFVITL
jgi:hypothetical protein